MIFTGFWLLLSLFFFFSFSHNFHFLFTYAQQIGGTLTFFHEEEARRCLEVLTRPKLPFSYAVGLYFSSFCYLDLTNPVGGSSCQ